MSKGVEIFLPLLCMPSNKIAWICCCLYAALKVHMKRPTLRVALRRARTHVSLSGVVEEVQPEIVKEAGPVPDCDLSPAEVPEMHLYPWHEQGLSHAASPISLNELSSLVSCSRAVLASLATLS